MSTAEYRGSVIDAYAIARLAHDGQFDRDGFPHLKHVTDVAALVPPDCLSVAWLHDVLEDSDWTPERLFDAGFDTCVIQAVMTLTRQDGETYTEYIARVDTRHGEVGRIARIVKEADLIVNLTRCLSAGEQPAADRYRKALVVLSTRPEISARRAPTAADWDTNGTRESKTASEATATGRSTPS